MLTAGMSLAPGGTSPAHHGSQWEMAAGCFSSPPHNWGHRGPTESWGNHPQTMGESPPREGTVKGGGELQRLEVAAAVLNVFIKEEAGEG